MNSKFSVIIPFFNGGKYITETISSVLSQDYDNFEVIVIDDCSSMVESSLLRDIVNGFEFKNLKLERNQENIGLLATLNLGLELANGDYIVVLGQDDLIENRHLSAMNNSILDCHSDFSIIFCDAHYIAGESKTNLKVRGAHLSKFTNSQVDYHSLMNWNYVCSTGVCLNKKVLTVSGGFNTKFRNYGEWLTWLKLCKERPVRINKGINSWYRRHQDNITNKMFKSGFRKTFNYYEYVNNYAYDLSDKTVNSKITYTKNKIKNYMLLIYKTVFNFSITHAKVNKN